ncbi:MAG: amidohydrolase family protein [Thermoplasmata archaeon]|nr:MAG: amidohydrolase family protein [Thermoplasmata archaeon]
MLLLKDEYDVIHNFMLVDAHTHLQVEGREGLVPYEFIKRFSKLVRDVALDIKSNEKLYKYHFPWDMMDENPDYYTYCQKDIYNIFHPGEDLSHGLEHFTGPDFIITFVASLTTPSPRDYRIANTKIREALIEKSPDNTPHNNLRFIGFGRVDPNHSDALDAFDNVFQLGLHGLKLHPKEENFDITDKRVVDILKRAAHYNMPVIFHTQEGSFRQIEKVVNDTLSDLIDSGRRELAPRLKVILGHAPWNGVQSEDLYRCLSHPNIFGELSTLRAESCREFFENSKAKIRYERIFEVEPLTGLDRKSLEREYFNYYGYNNINYWSSKLMFGSDTPYPPSHDAAPLLKHLFGREFPGCASDIQNILGASASRLIAPKATRNLDAGMKRASNNMRFHSKQMELLMKDSKILGATPVIENFPRVKTSGAVVSVLTDGDTKSYLFKSLFDSKKPLNMVLPNPYDLAASPLYHMSRTRQLEQCLSGE